MDELSRVKLSRVKDFISKVEQNTNNEDIEIGMEVFISAFFPDAYENLRQRVAGEYIRGYNDAMKEVEDK